MTVPDHGAYRVFFELASGVVHEIEESARASGTGEQGKRAGATWQGVLSLCITSC